MVQTYSIESLSGDKYEPWITLRFENTSTRLFLCSKGYKKFTLDTRKVDLSSLS